MSVGRSVESSSAGGQQLPQGIMLHLLAAANANVRSLEYVRNARGCWLLLLLLMFPGYVSVCLLPPSFEILRRMRERASERSFLPSFLHCRATVAVAAAAQSQGVDRAAAVGRSVGRCGVRAAFLFSRISSEGRREGERYLEDGRTDGRTDGHCSQVVSVQSIRETAYEAPRACARAYSLLSARQNAFLSQVLLHVHIAEARIQVAVSLSFSPTPGLPASSFTLPPGRNTLALDRRRTSRPAGGSRAQPEASRLHDVRRELGTGRPMPVRTWLPARQRAAGSIAAIAPSMLRCLVWPSSHAVRPSVRPSVYLPSLPSFLPSHTRSPSLSCSLVPSCLTSERGSERAS